ADGVAPSVKRHKSVCFGKRKGLEHDAIDHRVHDGGRGNAKREDQQRDRGETGQPREGSERIANVAGKVGDEADAAGVAVFFFDLFDSTQLDSGNAERLVTRHPATHRGRGALLDVEPQFVLELVVDDVRLTDRTKPKPPIRSHVNSPAAPLSASTGE